MMRKMIWLIFGVLFTTVLLMGCSKSQPKNTADEEGGVRIDTSYDAPKEIQSTDIIHFYCEFSNLTMMNEETFLENKVYELEALLKDGKVQCEYETYAGGEGSKETFEAEARFLKEIQKIIKNHNLIQHNGYSYRVSGLPDQFGAVLQVEYESGEKIYASDNQSNFLSVAVMEDLDELFRAQFEEIEVPKGLDFTVSRQFLLENINGRYVSLEYPVLELGYETLDGEWLHTDDYPALVEALSIYNKEEQDFHEGNRSILRSAANNIEGDDEAFQELYTYTDAYVTRNDTNVLSFYTFTRHFEGWVQELCDWETRNFDVKTGNNLSFEDIFTDLDELAQIVEAEIRAAYPELQFWDETGQLIDAGIRDNEGILFALSYEGVHIFAENQYLSGGDTKGQHIVLSYSDYPDLVKEAYRAVPQNWRMKLDYGVAYPLTPTMYLELTWGFAGSMENILWNARVNGIDYTEVFYGYAPDCYLLCKEGRYYISMRVPTGDVTLMTNTYEVTENEILFLGTEEGVIPEDIYMSLD